MKKLLMEYRKRANLTQADVAKMIGIKQAAVSWWETGRANPSANKLLDLAKLYRCTVDDLLHAEQKNEINTKEAQP